MRRWRGSNYLSNRGPRGGDPQADMIIRLDFWATAPSTVYIEALRHVLATVVRLRRVHECFLDVGVPSLGKAGATDRTSKLVLFADESECFSGRDVSSALTRTSQLPIRQELAVISRCVHAAHHPRRANLR